MLGLLTSGGAQGEGGCLCQRKLHRGGQVQLAAGGGQGSGDILTQDDAFLGAAGG